MRRAARVAALGLVACLAAAAAGCGGPSGRAKVATSPQLYWAPRPVGGGPRETPSQVREGGAALVELELEGRGTALRHARAIVRQGHLELALSSSPLTCDHPPAPRAGLLELTVPPGPYGSFFAGAEIGVPARATVRARAVGLAAREVRLRLEPFALARGARVRGTIRASPADGHAAGRFDAALCEVDVLGVAGPSPIVPDGPVAGALGARRFRAASAIALVIDDAREGRPRVAAITFFPGPVDCATWRARARTTTTFNVYEIGRASVEDRALGELQPMLPVLTDVAAGAPAGSGVDRFFGGALPFGQGWIRLDALDLEPGGVVAGVLVAESDLRSPAGGDGLIGGEFRAQLCR